MKNGSGDPKLELKVKIAEAQIRVNKYRAEKTEDELRRKRDAIADQRSEISSLKRNITNQGIAQEEYKQEVATLREQMEEAQAEFNEEKSFVTSVESEVVKDVVRSQDAKVSLEGSTEALENLTSGSLSIFPGVGEGYDILTLLKGEDPITHEQLNPVTRTLTVIGLVSGLGSGKISRDAGTLALEKLAKKTSIPLDDIYKASFEVITENYSQIKNPADLFAKKDILSISAFIAKVEKVALLNKKVADFPGVKYIDNISTKVAGVANHSLGVDITVKNSGAKKLGGAHSLRGLEKYKYAYNLNRIGGGSGSNVPYEATLSVLDASGNSITKTTNGGITTMFPNSWTESRILKEVEFAVKNNKGKALNSKFDNEYYGITEDGVEIHFYLDSAGNITSFFPKI